MKHAGDSEVLSGELHREIAATAPVSRNVLLESLSRKEIPSLFGLRGLAALVVIVYHYCIDWKVGEFPGYYAVTLFFEISGLLITWLLLKEVDVAGQVKLGQFYIRRSLRLFPVFYVVWALCRWRGPFPGSWAYFFYMGDYYTALFRNYSILTSAWSLGVEEKFYLLWPQVMKRLSRPTLMRVLIAVLAVGPVYRAILRHYGFELYTEFAFETNLDAIVLGCLIAVGVRSGWSAPRWLLHPMTLAVAIVAGVVGWRSSEIMMLSLAVVLLYVICRPPRWLNNPVARFLGEISYSLYLCHMLTASLIEPLLGPKRWNVPAPLGIAIEVVLSIGFATVLHFSVERPFLRLKERFHSGGRHALRTA